MLFTLAKLAVVWGLMFVGALTMYVTYRVMGGGLRGVARGGLATIVVFAILAFVAFRVL